MITIELPRASANLHGRYPDIRFFLAKKNNLSEIHESHIFPLTQSKKEFEAEDQEKYSYIDSECDKWESYGIDYMQGYHHNAILFTKA